MLNQNRFHFYLLYILKALSILAAEKWTDRHKPNKQTKPSLTQLKKNIEISCFKKLNNMFFFNSKTGEKKHFPYDNPDWGKEKKKISQKNKILFHGYESVFHAWWFSIKRILIWESLEKKKSSTWKGAKKHQ